MKKIMLLGFVFLLFSSFAYAADLDHGLINYWDFNAYSLNDINGSNNGVMTGALINVSDGKNNQAFKGVDGDNYINLSQISLGTTWSFSYWYRNVTNETTNIFAGQPTANNWIGWHNDGGAPNKYGVLKTSGGTVTRASFVPNALDTTWNHILITTDASSTIVYHNNVSYTADSASSSVDLKVLFRGFTTSTYSFSGGGDEVAIWNRKLDSAEATELYNGGTGLFFDGSTFYASAPVDNITVSNIADNSTSRLPQPNTYITHSALWNCTNGCDKYIFSWNNSGTWVNSSPVDVPSHNWTNVSMQVTQTVGAFVGWRIYANDSTNGEWESTGLQSYQVQPRWSKIWCHGDSNTNAVANGFISGVSEHYCYITDANLGINNYLIDGTNAKTLDDWGENDVTPTILSAGFDNESALIVAFGVNDNSPSNFVTVEEFETAVWNYTNIVYEHSPGAKQCFLGVPGLFNDNYAPGTGWNATLGRLQNIRLQQKAMQYSYINYFDTHKIMNHSDTFAYSITDEVHWNAAAHGNISVEATKCFNQDYSYKTVNNWELETDLGGNFSFLNNTFVMNATTAEEHYPGRPFIFLTNVTNGSMWVNAETEFNITLKNGIYKPSTQYLVNDTTGTIEQYSTTDASGNLDIVFPIGSFDVTISNANNYFTVTALDYYYNTTINNFTILVTNIGDNNTYNHSTTGLGDEYYYFNLTGASGTLYEINSVNGSLTYALPSACFDNTTTPGFVTIKKNQPFLGGINWTCGYNTSFNYQLGAFGDASSMDDLRIVFNSKYYTTTNGSIETGLLSTAGYTNVTINSNQNGGYFERVYLNQDTNVNLQATIWQAEGNFTAYEAVTLDLIVGGTFTSNGWTGPYFYFPAGDVSVSFNHTDYLFSTETYSISALSNSSYNFTAYTHILNITAIDDNGANVTSFNINIDSLNYTYTETSSTSNGYYEFKGINGSYNVTIDSSSHVVKSVIINLSSPLQNYTFNLTSTNTIDITFKDAETLVLLDFLNISLELIGTNNSYNYTTETGTIYQPGLIPDTYNLRFSAPGYSPGYYYFELINRSANTFTLYMYNQTTVSNVTAIVYDESNNLLEGALIKVLKYDSSTNAYIVTQISSTNFEGETILSILLNQEYYKFVIEYPAGTIVETTNPTYIFDTTIEFPVILGEIIAEDYFQVDNIFSNLIYINATRSFSWTYSDPLNAATEGCLYIYKYLNGVQTTYNSSCVSSSASTITLGVLNETGATYKAVATLEYNDHTHLMRVLWIEFKDTLSGGITPLLGVALLTIMFATMGYWSPSVALILSPLPLLFSSIIGLVEVSVSVSLSVLILCIFIVYLINRR